jgi:hypothetical protein
MSEFFSLIPDGSDNLRVAVADIHHANTARKVDVFPTLNIPQNGSLGRLDKICCDAGHTL